MSYPERMYVECMRKDAESLIQLVILMKLPVPAYRQAFMLAQKLCDYYLPLTSLHIHPCTAAYTMPVQGEPWNCRCVELIFRIKRVYMHTVVRDHPINESYNWWEALTGEPDIELTIYGIGQRYCHQPADSIVRKLDDDSDDDDDATHTKCKRQRLDDENNAL